MTALFDQIKTIAAVGAAPKPSHPFCNICGWRKGGVDSWNGVACKCGLSAPPMQWERERHDQVQTENNGGDGSGITHALAKQSGTAAQGTGAASSAENTDAQGRAVVVHAALIDVLKARIARLEADLTECLDYLENQVDVVDGDYGVPASNRAMQLTTMINETLGKGGF